MAPSIHPDQRDAADGLPVAVVYEDRLDAMVGVKILALSLAKHAPMLRLRVYTPHADALADIEKCPNVKICERHDLIGKGWSAKPLIMREALADCEAVIWLDSDVVITGDITSKLRRFEHGSIGVAQEFRLLDVGGGQVRAQAYGLEVGQSLNYAVNSGFVLMRQRHEAILRLWAKLLTSDAYLAAQRQPIPERPVSFLGDQDALWAVLSSEIAAEEQISFLRTGFDQILHCGANGYHLADRLKSFVRPKPVLVHMLGAYKPWSFDQPTTSRAQRFHQLCFELSPYFEEASQYRAKLSNPTFLTRRSRTAKFLNVMFLGNVATRGAPMALVASIADRLTKGG